MFGVIFKWKIVTTWLCPFSVRAAFHHHMANSCNRKILAANVRKMGGAYRPPDVTLRKEKRHMYLLVENYFQGKKSDD